MSSRIKDLPRDPRERPAPGFRSPIRRAAFPATEIFAQGGITVLSGTHVIPHSYPVIDWHTRLAAQPSLVQRAFHSILARPAMAKLLSKCAFAGCLVEGFEAARLRMGFDSKIQTGKVWSLESEVSSRKVTGL